MNIEAIRVKIKKIRRQQGLRQSDLAQKSGVPLTTLTKIETGIIKNPSIKKIAKIAKALKVSVDELINYNYEKINQNEPKKKV